MSWKVKLAARCSKPEQELLSYADEAKNTNTILNTKLLQSIKAWNED